MPRKKKPKVLPVSTFIFIENGQEYEVEVWETYPDKGAPGTHRRKCRSAAFDAALIRLADNYYFSDSQICRDLAKRRLYDSRFNSELVSEIKRICLSNKIKVGRSTIYEVAKDVKNAIKAMDNAIEANRVLNAVSPPVSGE